MSKPEIRVRSWIRGSESDARSGLLGYLSVLYGGIVLDGITLRRTAEGRFALSFPTKTDRAGRRHPFVRPVDDQARSAIEAEILGQLGQRPDLQPSEEASDG